MARNSLIYFVVFALVLCNINVLAQKDSSASIPVYIGDTLQLDSLSLVPESTTLYDSKGNKIDTSEYTIDALKSQIIWKEKSSFRNQPVSATYKTFPFSFYEEYKHKDVDAIQNTIAITQNPFRYTAGSGERSDIFELGGIEKTGSISRGIGFGNSRDVSVNSSMNLQFNGKIAPNLYVMAAISDENIPIQPEGNTQQLQDFDKVFIQVYNNRARLIAGDYLIKSKNSYFMRYMKKAQGVSGSSRFYLGKNRLDTSKAAKMDVQVSGALSRGKFSRNIIQGTEGNQGPYRLSGEENESFIIILSGTERVFIDGKLLTRGQDQDYIINYNTAEITFTAKQIITKDKRIIVEFQYSDQNYTRSLVQFSDHYQHKKLKLNLGIYSEQDAKNQSLQQDLSPEQEQILANVGDSLHLAISSGATIVEFNDNEVLYKMIDTLGYDSVFVYSSNPDSAFYRITFSEVGQGNGDYILLNTVANGRVYQWLAPSTGGVKQGNYAPVVRLYAPKQRQMVTVGGSYDFNKNSQLSFETALSNNDVNTFSELDSEDNTGFAGTVNWHHEFNLNEKKTWALKPKLEYEHWSKTFTEIERIRTVEFYRNWNLRDVQLKEDQILPKAGIELIRNARGKLSYNLDGFYSGEEYQAANHNVSANWKHKGTKLDFDGNYLQSDGSIRQSEFIRHKTFLQQKVFLFNLGYRDDREDNQQIDILSDTLSANTYRFWERELFISSLDSATVEYKLFYNQRDDDKADNNELQALTYGESMGVSFNWRKNKSIQIASKTTYRVLEIRNPSLTTQEPDNNLLSRLEYNLRVWKGALIANSFYEVGSGLEAGREYQYVEVPAGQGEYMWIDYNENGIKELNEFEIAIFDDQKKYLRISILTDNYVKTNTLQFNQSIQLNPGRVWRKKEGIRKFLSAFSDQFAYRINRKSQNNDLDARFNPIPTVGIDTQLVSLNSSLRNTIYYNRTHPVYGLDWTYQDIRARTFLTNGFESQSNIFHNLRGRVNIGRHFLVEVISKLGDKSSLADYTSSRDYQIQYSTLNPKLTFQKGVNFRFAVLYEFQEKKNAADLGGELGIHHKLGVESKLNKVGKGSFTVEANLINVDYTGTGGSSLSYEMLEGLLPGVNATWQASYQRNIGKYLQMDLSYSGRSSEDSNTVHTGTMRVRAYF